MKRIEVKILNPGAVMESEKMMVCAARLTQRGHKIKSIEDFSALYDMKYSGNTINTLVKLPHPTIQKFSAINAVVIGASRRFLAQITRHQNEVKFMSASLQYSDYSEDADFVVPYELLGTDKEADYLGQCKSAMEKYMSLIRSGVDNDSAGYTAPQSLRNAIIISASPYQWKHMIGQRTCRRNTPETRYIMLRIWEELYKLSPAMFSVRTSGAFCLGGGCKEGRMSCGTPFEPGMSPSEIIAEDFPLLARR